MLVQCLQKNKIETWASLRAPDTPLATRADASAGVECGWKPVGGPAGDRVGYSELTAVPAASTARWLNARWTIRGAGLSGLVGPAVGTAAAKGVLAFLTTWRGKRVVKVW